ncbi:MAG: glycosyltransferase family 9 protein [Mariprofundaceae bacterium]
MKNFLLSTWMKYLARKGVKRPFSVDEIPIQRIVLWQFGGLGDMLLATPVIRALEEKWPDAEVYIYCSHPQFADFLKRFANVKSIVAFPVYGFDARTLLRGEVRQSLRSIGDDMRAVAPDMLINLHVPAMLDWWAVEWWLVKQLKIGITLGFNPRFIGHGSVFHASLNGAARDDTHYTSLYQKLLQKAGIAADEKTLFPLFDADKEKAGELLVAQGIAADRRCVCLHIGGRRLKVEDKMWPIERFAELARRLISAGLTPLLIGVQSERDMGEALCAVVPDCINLIGDTQMQEMAALIALADGFIGHDSGPFHIAVAVGTPCVAICGRPDAEPEYLKYDRASVHVFTAASPERISVDAVFAGAMRSINVREH